MVAFGSCTKKNTTPQCTAPAIEFHQPFTDPVWHPGAQIVGFNHTPLVGFFANGVPPCEWYMNSVKFNSLGFYLLNRDGTGFKRVTDYRLTAPSWSPDGEWLAFSLGNQIYKMPFDGQTFDTAQIVQITDSGSNFFPCWTADSDTIYFDSNVAAPEGTSFYSVWKMTSDGSRKQMVSRSTDKGDEREPYIGDDNRIYYVGYANKQPEIFSMNKDGSEPVQLTFNGKNGNRRTPKVFQNNLFFLDGGVNSTLIDQFNPKKIVVTGSTFDISRNGEIVYPNGLFKMNDKRWGTLWIIKHDGSDSIQLTFNH